MKINKKILFTPILGLLYVALLTFLEHDNKDERLKAIAIFYHGALIVIFGVLGQHFHSI